MLLLVMRMRDTRSRRSHWRSRDGERRRNDADGWILIQGLTLCEACKIGPGCMMMMVVVVLREGGWIEILSWVMRWILFMFCIFVFVVFFFASNSYSSHVDVDTYTYKGRGRRAAIGEQRRVDVCRSRISTLWWGLGEERGRLRFRWEGGWTVVGG